MKIETHELSEQTLFEIVDAAREEGILNDSAVFSAYKRDLVRKIEEGYKQLRIFKGILGLSQRPKNIYGQSFVKYLKALAENDALIEKHNDLVGLGVIKSAKYKKIEFYNATDKC